MQNALGGCVEVVLWHGWKVVCVLVVIGMFFAMQNTGTDNYCCFVVDNATSRTYEVSFGPAAERIVLPPSTHICIRLPPEYDTFDLSFFPQEEEERIMKFSVSLPDGADNRTIILLNIEGANAYSARRAVYST